MAEGNGSGALSFLAGGGEMGERIRSFDWASTSLGSPEGWPQSLKTSIRIMLMSRQPVWIGWGEDLLYFYNDPYFSIIGGKHPDALGKPTREVWHEIWDVIAPMLATAMSGDEGTYAESQLLIMERNGYPEETYYTFSYSPIPDDQGKPGGIICANTDDTQRVIGQRELALLRDLAARTSKSRTAAEACERAVASLATDPWDIPFAALYLLDEESGDAKLQGICGIDRGDGLAPESLPKTEDGHPIWRAAGTPAPFPIEELGGAERLPTGAWPTASNQAVVLPLTAAGEASRGGLLIVGLSPYRLFDGPYSGFLNLVAGQIAAAISDAEAIDRERQRMEAMAELDRAKSAFFANVSHEFRTPLTLMLGPLQDVLSHDLGIIPARVHLELDTVRRNGLRLQKLVNTLLDFSRLEAGRMKAEYRPTDVASLTSELASSFQSAIDRAGLKLVVNCPPLSSRDRPFVDTDLWEKVVLNLVSNAFKHTFEGSIRVEVRKTGGAVQLLVADSGIGISLADQSTLFQRFRRVEGARSRTHEGSGIGLALVQEIVRLHGGEISVDSRTEGPERGTTFVVQIPLGRAHLPAEQVVDETADRARRSGQAASGEVSEWLPDSETGIDDVDTISPGLPLPVRTSGARILLADDNADMRGYITRLLSRSYEIEAVPNGEAALEAIQRSRPDIVITDVMMPRLDGFGLVKAIRSDAATSGIPVIMLSARAGEEARIEGLDSGADDYLVKPFSARELIARVDSALALARLRDEASEALKISEDRLQMALSAARMVAWQWDPHSNALLASDNIWEIFGIAQAQSTLLASDFEPLIHEEDKELHGSRIQRAIVENGSYISQYRARRADDGTTIWLEDRGRVIRDETGEARLMGVLMDITERKQVERERADAEQLLAAEKRVLESITSGAPLHQILELLAVETEGLSRDGMMCSILILDESRTRLLHGAAPSLPDAYNEAIHGIQIGPGVGSCGTAAYEGRPVTVSDIANDPYWAAFKDLALEHGLRSCSSRPMFSSQGDLLGTVAMYYSEPHVPSLHDEELIERAARLAGIVVERDQAIAAAEAERARLRDLFTKAPALVCTLKGPQHVFELANPIYLQAVGRTDPAQLVGKTIREALPEIEGQGFIELLDRVYTTGKPYFGNEVPVRLDRHGNGELEEVLMNFVYQPSTGASGETDGILVHAVDVTELVHARKRAEELAQELERRMKES